VLTCGPDDGADVRVAAQGVAGVLGEDGFRTEFSVRVGDEDLVLELALAGMHNVRNAVIAVTVASVLRIGSDAIRAGLAGLEPVAGRLNPRTGPGGLRLIDDSYNANPDSVRAAVDVLVGLPGRHWLVLGDLGELGADALRLHGELGAAARTAGVDALYAVGELSRGAVAAFGKGARHFVDQAGLIAALREELGPGDLVLVKGSRRAAMERVADALCAGGAV